MTPVKQNITQELLCCLFVHLCVCPSLQYSWLLLASLVFFEYLSLFIVPHVLANVGDFKTHIFWNINDRAMIFGMHDPYDKPFKFAQSTKRTCVIVLLIWLWNFDELNCISELLQICPGS